MTQYREWSSTPVAWEVAKNTDPDVPILAHRILPNIAHAHAGAPKTTAPASPRSPAAAQPLLPAGRAAAVS
jgi:hypothetical protein